MRDDDRRFFLRWAEQPEYLARRREALRITADALRNRRPYVAFSPAARIPPSCCTWHARSEAMSRRIITTMARRCRENTLRSCAMSQYRPGVSELVIGRRTGGLRTDFKENETEMIGRGFDSAFIGLRRGESIARKRKIDIGYRYGRIDEHYPLADFSANDVWAYIASENVRYVSYYDTYSDLTDIRDLRFTTFFDPVFSHLGAENLNAFKDWRHAYE